MGTKAFGESMKERYPGLNKYLSTETEDAYFLDLSGCEVRYVSAGESLLHYTLAPIINDKNGWIVAKNCGQNPDGSDLFMVVTDLRLASREEALAEWAWLRRRLEG